MRHSGSGTGLKLSTTFWKSSKRFLHSILKLRKKMSILDLTKRVFEVLPYIQQYHKF